MNLAKTQTVIRVVREDEFCDYCGKPFAVGEDVFRIADPVTEDVIYFCVDRSACAARERGVE